MKHLKLFENNNGAILDLSNKHLDNLPEILPDSIEELDVYKVPHPNNPTEYIYMVNTEIKQYERVFKLITVPEYLEESHKFSCFS